ncbi:GGDEF domain-containing protein [Pseudofrankia asymbiotica]|uniref:GGDEF domain-containing protein n=1 Tax=Pseudofrankia asymbiotica TaxID=1834516 RepID=A0A1V2I318_9ACTN|nr:GGDEF domain-containing protein [Pseudofrankia asymbiotica]ONH24438.1 hypothetical protein BL253_30295 [Pseudofrankia asymbiotica]
MSEPSSPPRREWVGPGPAAGGAAGGPALSRRVFLVVAALLGCAGTATFAVSAALSGTARLWAMYLTPCVEYLLVAGWATWRGLRARPPVSGSPGTRPRGGDRWAAERRWRLLIAAMMALAAASRTISLVDLASNGPSWPGPLPAVILLVVAPPLGIAGLLLIPTEPAHPALAARPVQMSLPGRAGAAVPGGGGRRAHKWTAQLVLDTLLIVGSIALVVSVGPLAGLIHGDHLPGEGAWLAAAQVVMLALEMVLVILLAAFRRPRNVPAVTLLAVGLISVSISHAVMSYLSATGAEPGPRAFLGYIFGPLLFALATAAPEDLFRAARRRPVASAARPSPRTAAGGARVPPPAALPERLALWAHVFLPYVPLGAAAGVVVGLLAVGRTLDTVAVALAVVLVVIVLVRQLLTVAQNTRLLASVEVSQRELSYQAWRDALTGLANRAAFADLLAARVAARNSALPLVAGASPDHDRPWDGRTARRGGAEPARLAPAEAEAPATPAASAGDGSPGQLAVLFCDLDDFKDVNDSLGHAAGDELLTAVARRLRASVRDEDVAARIGGDEFAILLGGPTADAAGAVATAEDGTTPVTDTEGALGDDAARDDLPVRVARRVVSAMSRPFEIDGRRCRVHASVGLAVEDGPGPVDAEDLLRRADAAMYTAKRGGKGRLVVARSPGR